MKSNCPGANGTLSCPAGCVPEVVSLQGGVPSKCASQVQLTVPVGRNTVVQGSVDAGSQFVKVSSRTHNPEKLDVAVPFDPPVFHVTFIFIVPCQPLQPAVPAVSLGGSGTVRSSVVPALLTTRTRVETSSVGMSRQSFFVARAVQSSGGCHSPPTFFIAQTWAPGSATSELSKVTSRTDAGKSYWK